LSGIHGSSGLILYGIGNYNRAEPIFLDILSDHEDID